MTTHTERSVQQVQITLNYYKCVAVYKTRFRYLLGRKTTTFTGAGADVRMRHGLNIKKR